MAIQSINSTQRHDSPHMSQKHSTGEDAKKPMRTYVGLKSAHKSCMCMTRSQTPSTNRQRSRCAFLKHQDTKTHYASGRLGRQPFENPFASTSRVWKIEQVCMLCFTGLKREGARRIFSDLHSKLPESNSAG